jgi:NTE family protein/lysophospholipid hydrolase
MDDPDSGRAASGTDLRTLLASTPPFDGLPGDVLAQIARRMTRLELASGQTLYQKGDLGDAMYLVLSGRLGAAPAEDAAAPAPAEYGPATLVGEMQLVIGGRRDATVRAAEHAQLARLEKPALEALAKDAPQLIIALGDLIRRRLREEQVARVLKDVFGELDAATLRRIERELEWVELRPGEALFAQGDPSDCMYLVVSGRLIGVREGARERRIVAEIGRGESVGEMGFLTGEPRSAAIYARRASHLVRFRKPVFDRLSHEYPKAMLYIAQLLIRRLRRASGFIRESFERSNIVVLPASAGVRATEFTERLVEALRVHGKTLYVSAPRLDAFVGVPGFAQTPAESPLDLALEAGLDDRESGYRYAVYECDQGDTAWTRRSIERADRILLLADAAADPALSPVERSLLGAQPELTAARRTLVLLHPETTALPSGTRHWLAPRALDSHHHLRRDRNADFARLARFLTGNAIGAVLGGGGARGFAHVGVIRALREAGIPIDLIGGTSMGALIAVQPALGWDDATMLDVNRRSFVEKKPVTLRDYTVPVYSLLDGRRLDENLVAPLGDVRIEDLWTGYFCVSSNLTRAEPMVHREGPVWKAIRASLAIPGVFAPVLAGTELLVDGGVLNNLPGDVVRQLGGGWVIAVDVSLERDLEVRDAILPPPWKVLLNWLNPFAKRIELPNLLSLLVRTTLLASVQKTEEMKKNVDLYIQPPVNRFRLMQFRAFEEIAETGYRHARAVLGEWIAQRPEFAQMLRTGGSPSP